MQRFKSSHRVSVAALLFGIVVLSSGLVYAQTNWYVNATTGSDLMDGLSPAVGTPPEGPKATIQAAIDASSANDTINVAAGTYAAHVNVSKSLYVRGEGSATTKIEAPLDFFTNPDYRYQSNAALFNPRAALVRVAPGTIATIRGFTVDGKNPDRDTSLVAFTGILVEQATATITKNVVKNFLPADTSEAVSSSLSGRGIEILGGSGTSVIDSNAISYCQRFHIQVSATDDKTTSPGSFPKAIVNANTITGLGKSKLGQKGIWLNWGAYGRVTNNSVTDLDYTDAYIESDRGSGIVIRHSEYKVGGERTLIAGNTVSASSFTNNKGIFAEGYADTISDNIVDGFRFGIQLDDQDAASVLRNTVTGGQIGVMVSRTNTTDPIAPYTILIGGSPANKNVITGQVDSVDGGFAIALSFRDFAADGTFLSTVPVDAKYNDFGVYSESGVRKRIWDRADTTLANVDTVHYYPFYVDKIRASVQVYLQGPYTANGDSMTNALKTGGHLASHFGAVPIPARAVDSINIELRNAQTTAGSTTRKFAPAWLLTDGTIRNFSDTTKSYVEFDTSYSGDYYFVVRHRNHLAIMCSTAQKMDGGTSPAVYDFSTGQSKAFGTDPMVSAGTKFAMWAGDVSGNGQIRYNLAGNDRAPILSRVGGTNINATASGYYNEDVNMNGVVRYNLAGNDRAIILNNVGGTNINSTRNTQVP
jgi:hypothetical protein